MAHAHAHGIYRPQKAVSMNQTTRHFSFTLWGLTLDIVTVPGWHWDGIDMGFSRDTHGITWAWPHRTGRSVFVVDVSYERLS